jgi:methionyl-tRNA synthetase
MSEAHQRDFAGFGIEFDNYGSTNSEEGRALAHEIWGELRKKDLIVEKPVTQFFDPESGAALADRFVKGTCPNCKSVDQYGDNCEKCGAAYAATDLIDPKSVHSGMTPESKTVPHWFVQIEDLHAFLDEWTQSGDHLQPEIAKFLQGNFLKNPVDPKDPSKGVQPLRDWDVSRPAPYFGFEIPDAPGHFWYVWFDAPIGYIGSTKQWCDKNGEKLEDWWKSDETEIHHFIGKDITYFHTLFWPAMLKSSGYSLPTRVQIHGFLTVNGEKMSKSRGTMVRASTYLKHLDPGALRYFYATKLSNNTDDLDLDVDEFVTKVNSDLVGKVVNLASRTAKFTRELSAEYPDDGGLFENAKNAGEEIAAAYEACEYAKAQRLIMALADRANEYLDKAEPWKVKKEPGREQDLKDICTIALNLYRQIVVYLSPVLPGLAADSAQLLNAVTNEWSAASAPLVGHEIGKFKHLMKRVDLKNVEKMMEEEKEAAEAQAESVEKDYGDSKDALEKEPLAETITFDDFTKVDLRVARIVKAEHMKEAKKLLKLTVSLGGDDRRNVFAGIKAAYQPEDLEGRLVVVVANLAPRKMKFGVSEGMVVCAGEGGGDLFVLSPDSGAKVGQRIS